MTDKYGSITKITESRYHSDGGNIIKLCPVCNRRVSIKRISGYRHNDSSGKPCIGEELSPEFPLIKVNFPGYENNVFSICKEIMKLLKEQGVSESDVAKFKADSMSYTFDHFVSSCKMWVTVEL